MPTHLASRAETLTAYNGLRSESHFTGHRRGVVTAEARMTDMTSQAVDRPALEQRWVEPGAGLGVPQPDVRDLTP